MPRGHHGAICTVRVLAFREEFSPVNRHSLDSAFASAPCVRGAHSASAGDKIVKYIYRVVRLCVGEAGRAGGDVLVDL